MLEDFKRALTRVQGDYQFYVDCQANPVAALASYDLTADELSVLSNPRKLAAVLHRGIGVDQFRFSFIITISGTHDWVNRVAPDDKPTDKATIATDIEAIKQAPAGDERTQAVLRLIEQIG